MQVTGTLHFRGIINLPGVNTLPGVVTWCTVHLSMVDALTQLHTLQTLLSNYALLYAVTYLACTLYVITLPTQHVTVYNVLPVCVICTQYETVACFSTTGKVCTLLPATSTFVKYLTDTFMGMPCA